MPNINDLQSPEFLESAAAELRAEAERVQAAAQRLRSGQPLAGESSEALNAEILGGFEKCSNICGQCCFCSPC